MQVVRARAVHQSGGLIEVVRRPHGCWWLSARLRQGRRGGLFGKRVVISEEFVATNCWGNEVAVTNRYRSVLVWTKVTAKSRIGSQYFSSRMDWVRVGILLEWRLTPRESYTSADHCWQYHLPVLGAPEQHHGRLIRCWGTANFSWRSFLALLPRLSNSPLLRM